MPSSRQTAAAPSSFPKRMSLTPGWRSSQLCRALRWMTATCPTKGFGVVKRVSMECSSENVHRERRRTKTGRSRYAPDSFPERRGPQRRRESTKRRDGPAGVPKVLLEGVGFVEPASLLALEGQVTEPENAVSWAAFQGGNVDQPVSRVRHKLHHFQGRIFVGAANHGLNEENVCLAKKLGSSGQHFQVKSFRIDFHEVREGLGA